MIDINKLVAAVDNDVCNILAGLHTFTVCDTICAFVGKGKIKPLKLLKSEYYVRDAFSRLGQMWEVQSNLHTDLKMLTCQLYSSETSQVNQACYSLFCSRNGQLQSTNHLARTACGNTLPEQISKQATGDNPLKATL